MFLKGLVSLIVGEVLERVPQLVSLLYQKIRKYFERRKDIKDANEAVKKLRSAKGKDEVDHALDDLP